jgi:hypothetical protein
MPQGNLVLNSSFEDATAWRFVRPGMADAGPFLDGSASHSGARSAKLERTAGGNCPESCGYWSAPITVVPGNDYTISVWFRGDEGVVNRFGVYVTMRVQTPDGSYAPLYAFIGDAESDGWLQASGTFAVPVDITAILIDISPWRNMALPDAAGVIWIDDVSVVSGRQP